MKIDSTKHMTWPTIMRYRLFWGIIAVLVVLVFLHYPQYITGDSFLSNWATDYAVVERLLFLIPIIYAGFYFGSRIGIGILVAAVLVMLPRAIFLSTDIIISVIEVGTIAVTGGLMNLAFRTSQHYMALNASLEEVLSGITDGYPVATYVLDKQHRVIHWNKAIESLTGIKREEVIGTHGHRRALFESNKKIMADLILDGASEEEIKNRYEGKSLRPGIIEGAFDAEDYFPVIHDKLGKWLHFTACPIKDKSGNIIGAIETLADISERKAADAALLQSESNYRNLFERARDAMWVTDRFGKILDVNESAGKLTGFSRDELQKSNIKLFLSESSFNKYSEVQMNLLKGQFTDHSYEQKIIRKNGDEVICMITTNLITHNGVSSAFQSSARDVTEERRHFENQQHYLKEITRAQEEERKRIARELHDSTAQNLIALLHQLEYFLDDKAKIPVGQAKGLWDIYEHVRDILQEVRRFSRDLRPSILDDLGLLPALEWLVAELKSNYGIETSLVKTGEERRLAPEAELLIFRIVQESLNNAVKHAKASNVVVKVEFVSEKFIVTITDNGIGFSQPENLDKLIQTGKLGLAGMEERVQLMGGKLSIISGPRQGTSIRVEANV